MKSTSHLRAALLGLSLAASHAPAQIFDCGSDGSYGHIHVTNVLTLPMPPDGIFKCGNILVEGGAELRFIRNALNTPVYLLATGTVTINGHINVNGQEGGNFFAGIGGPGGFDGGAPTDGVVPAGHGQGPGGGVPGLYEDSVNAVGAGSYGSRPGGYLNASDGPIYGNPTLMPLIGGSGGAGSTEPAEPIGGSGGGGAILIASNIRISLAHNNGIIAFSGGYYNGTLNKGSGGAVRLVAPEIIGNGYIDVWGYYNYSGRGRIRFDTLRRDLLQVDCRPASARSIGSTMVVFPNPNPSLSIAQVATSNIVEGAQSAVLVNLPFGTATNQPVVVRARDFNGVVPVRVAVTPEYGPASFFDGSVDNTAVNPATATINVNLPVNTLTRVTVWTY